MIDAKLEADWKAEETARLRDLFAAHALTGLLAFSPQEGSIQMSAVVAAEEAYAVADAMIVQRTKVKSTEPTASASE